MADPNTNPFAAMLPSFFFGNDKNDPRVNPQLRQKIALAMMARQSRFPKNVGEGLSSIGDAIGDRGLMKQLMDADIGQQDQAAKLLGGGATPAAPPTGYAPPSPLASAPPVQAIDAAAGPPGVIPPPAAPPPAPLTTAPSPAPAPPGPIADGGYNSIDAQAGFKRPTPGYIGDAIARNVADPDRQAYLGSLVGGEAPRGPADVSPTGADGPFQFTRGTARQYGLMGPQGDQRRDLDASVVAANRLTDDNAAAFQHINGRPPTPADLAVLHQQGGVTGSRMIAGTGNAPAGNLAVNNIPTNASPAAAVARIKSYYGMPDQATPRDQIAGAVLAQQGAPTGAQGAPPSQPPMAFSGIQAAPPQPSGGIRPAPQQLAQAQPAPVAGYVPPELKDPTGAPIVPMHPEEKRLRDLVTANPNLQYLPAQVAARIEPYVKEREIRQNEANEKYKADLARATKQNEMRQQALMTQAERQRADQKSQQELISSPTSTATDPRLLGTPQSPQRTGIPAVPPVPPGVSPKEWSEKQTPEMVKAVSAVQKATPQFNQMMDLIQQAENHPGKEWAVGPMSGVTGHLPSAQGFKKIMDQIGGQNFLNVYQQLKGGGSITEIEGTKAEAAQARLSTAQTKQDFDKAMLDFKNAVRQDMETVQRKVNQPVTAWQKSPDDDPAPDIGQVGTWKGKLREYIGGNPALDSSYRIAR